MALIKRSAGNRPARFCGERHHTSAPTVPILLIALSQNGAASPNPAMITPPSAGPTARLILMPTLLAATAGASSGLETSKGTIDCQAGAVSDAPVPIKNMNSNTRPGVARWSQTIAPNKADKIVMAVSTTIINRRLSTISASAPAGIANRNIGSPLATCTNDTDKTSVSRLVISQPAAALYIQEPMFATTVAVQMTVKTRLRNGLHGEGATDFGLACGPDPLATVIAIRAHEHRTPLLSGGRLRALPGQVGVGFLAARYDRRCGAQVKHVALYLHHARLGLAQPVGEQRHKHRMRERLL